jgi:hypothetical protein
MKTGQSLTCVVFLVGAIACAAVFAQEPRSKKAGQGERAWPEIDATAQDPLSASDANVIFQNGWAASNQPGNESVQLAHKYSKTENEDEKRDVRKKLHDTVSREFDQNIKHQEKELDGIEKQITHMRSLAEKRASAKDRIVDRRIQQLVDEANGLGWHEGAARTQDPALPAADFVARFQEGQHAWGFAKAPEGTGALVKKYAKAETGDEKQDLHRQIAEALSRQFDEHMKLQEKELKELEKQVSSLKAVIKKRLDAKSSIVDRRVEQLVLDAEGLGWGTPGKMTFGRPGFYFNPAPPNPYAPAKEKTEGGPGR